MTLTLTYNRPHRCIKGRSHATQSRLIRLGQAAKTKVNMGAEAAISRQALSGGWNLTK